MSLLTVPSGYLRGFLIPEYHMLGATVAASTQAGPRPGGFVASGDYTLAPVGTGVLDNAMSELQMVTLRAGDVGAATVRWGYTGEDLRQHDSPALVSAWEFVDRSAVAGKYTSPHVIRASDTGRAVASVTVDSTTVAVWTQSRGGLWSSVTIEDTGLATVSTLVSLASGRLVCLYVYGTSASTTQIRQAYSDDGGATWTIGSTACISAAQLAYASSEYLRIRAVELNGVLCVVLWQQNAADAIWQYVSKNGGATLDLVEQFSGVTQACPDLAVSRGRIWMATIQHAPTRTGSDRAPYVRSISSASSPLSGVAEVDAGSSTDLVEWGLRPGVVMTRAECALLADDDGRLWVYGVEQGAGTNHNVMHRVSDDGGATWGASYASRAAVSPPEGTVLFVGDTTSYWRDLTVAPERGRAVMLHRMEASVAEDSLCAAFLGGWTTVGMPESATYGFGMGQAGWANLWIPIEKPQNITGADTWAETLTFGATSTLTTGLTLSTAMGESAYYTVTPTVSANPEQGIIAEWRLTPGAGTWRHEVAISNGANDFTVRLLVTTTTLTLRDQNAGADLGSATVDTTDDIVIRIAIGNTNTTWNANNGWVRAWYRRDGVGVTQGPAADQKWTSIGSGIYTGLTFGAAIVPRIEWGIYLSIGSAGYRRCAYAAGGFTAGNLEDYPNGPSRGRLLSGKSSPIHLAEGLRVHGTGGPTVAGETWTTNTDYENPARNLDPSIAPSPRRTWRSTGDAAQVDITWTGLDLGWRAGDMLGIMVLATNIATANLYRDTGAANLVAALDFTHPGLNFDRSRGQIVPKTGGSSSLHHFAEGAMIGGHVDLGGGDIRRIRANSAGAWLASGAVGSYPSVRVELDSYDVADASTGALTLRMPSALFITEALAATDTLMLRIPVQDTAENYFEIGTILIGRVRFVQQWARGRSAQTSWAYALTRSQSGATTARRLGPSARAVEVAWDDAIDTSGTNTPGLAPDHVAWVTGGNAVYAPADTPSTIGGLLDRVGGAVVPIGLLSAVKQQATNTTASAPYRDLNPQNFLFGRAEIDSIRWDNQMGDEGRDPGEVLKGSMVRVVEEV